MRRANDPQRREKIIQATLEAVKLYGIHAVTHRKIATFTTNHDKQRLATSHI